MQIKSLIRRLSRKQTLEVQSVSKVPVYSHDLLFGSLKSADYHTSTSELPTVVLIGNCIAEGMQVGLSSANGANSKFRFMAIPLHLRALQDRDCLDIIGEASHVFVQQLGGLDWSLIKSTMSSTAKLFSFPSLVQWNLWPFDSNNGYPDDLAQAVPEGQIRHFDGTLARLRKIEPDKKKRIARYRELDFEWASKIDVIAETQRRFHADIDANSDCHLGRFIERFYKERQLFYDGAHPSEIIFQELCEHVWRKLELTGTPPSFLGMDGWRNWSLPIHPGIARRLGVVWAHDSTRYKYCTLGDITWQNWVEVYVETFG